MPLRLQGNLLALYNEILLLAGPLSHRHRPYTQDWQCPLDHHRWMLSGQGLDQSNRPFHRPHRMRSSLRMQAMQLLKDCCENVFWLKLSCYYPYTARVEYDSSRPETGMSQQAHRLSRLSESVRSVRRNLPWRGWLRRRQKRLSRPNDTTKPRDLNHKDVAQGLMRLVPENSIGCDAQDGSEGSPSKVCAEAVALCVGRAGCRAGSSRR
jgi:hypothetical protein